MMRPLRYSFKTDQHDVYIRLESCPDALKIQRLLPPNTALYVRHFSSDNTYYGVLHHKMMIGVTRVTNVCKCTNIYDVYREIKVKLTK